MNWFEDSSPYEGRRVDIGVPCSAFQNHSWWAPNWGLTIRESKAGVEIGHIMAISSALPDFNKNNTVGGGQFNEEDKRRHMLTDSNRVAATFRFMQGSEDWLADWMFWIDDDVVLPEFAISRLLAHKKPFVAGLYFNPNPPKNPIAYLKDTGGFYKALYDYPEGALIPVDSVGMGCTLIHRSVYKKIMDEHVLIRRPTGALYPIHKSKVMPDANHDMEFMSGLDTEELVIGNHLITKIKHVENTEGIGWPFYSMEFGRTEDHHFCEMACNVGFRPWVDTTIVCGHSKFKPMDYQEYKDYINKAKGLA